MKPHLFRLGLITTYRCNAECRHCFFEAGPLRDEVMSIGLGLKVIDEAVELGAEWISFTGGEPFLEPEILERLVQYAISKKLQTEIVTNCFWATTIVDAEKTLKLLRDKGLDALNLSVDDFHQEYVPIEYVKNAYQAALSLELKVVIMTTTIKDSKITAETIPYLLGDNRIQIIGASRIRDPHALLTETTITPAGRGASIKNVEYSLISEIKCKEALRDIGVAPNGDVFPCCGSLALKKPLGNINTRSLKEIIDEAWNDPLFISLRNGVDVAGPFTSRCHACLSLQE